MSPTATHNLLLVEDEAIIALSEKKSLEEYGYTVTVANTGERAIEAVEADGGIDLILMDIDLGRGMDGTEAAEAILSRLELPIIFLSSHTEREIVEKTEGTTSYGYVVKNSGITVLDAAIKMAFRLFEAHRSISAKNMELQASNEQLRTTNEQVAQWQELFEYIVYHDRSSVAVLDKDLIFRYVSRRFIENYGAETELVGHHHYEAIPEVPEKWREIHRRALNGETVSSDFDTFERPDGRVDYAAWECRPWYESDGSIGGIVLYTEIITERVRTEERLRQSEQRYKNLVEQSPDIVYLFGTESGGILWSEATRRILGYDPQDVINDPFLWNRSVHPEDKQLVETAIENAIDGKPFDIEYRIAGADGRYVWLRDKLIDRREQDGEILIQGHAEDITAQKNAEAEIRDYQWRLESIIEGAQVGTWEWNIQTGEVEFNETWAEIVGYTLEELQPVSIKTWESFAHDEDLEESGKLLERHFAGEIPYYDAEVRMKHKSGDWVWVRDRGKVSSWTEEGRPLMMFGTHTDVTDRKNAELQAKQLVIEKEHLLKEVHHRIKNNMNTIRSLLSLKANSTESETVQESLRDAAARLNAMQVLYDQLYRSEEYRILSVDDYLRNLTSQVVAIFPESQQVTLDIHADPVTLHNRALSSLGMILTEWITNAFKHSFAPAADRADEKGLRINAEKRGSMLALVFAVSGGTQPDPRKLDEGAGFGLQMIRALVEQLNGTLTTEVDDGLRFELEFPVEQR